MLRTGLATDQSNDERTSPCWRASSGTAGVLGLRPVHMDVAPTTAYLMLGERCSRNCAFCTQARESRAGSAALSRVTWPEFPAEQVADAITRAYREGRVTRACFQVTISPGYIAQTRQAVAELAGRCAIPICASMAPQNVESVADLLAAGAQRVSIALDAACERVYRQVKSGSWSQTLDLLEQCARRYPGHIGTHLIVGLGETEEEMAYCLQHMADLSVSVGLFSFTPVEGTPLAHRPPPPLSQYRRMQAARWLITHHLARAEDFRYNAQGTLQSYGLAPAELRALLADGEAFRTSGCPGCNRPYYNERPGGTMYNYPRPLRSDEAIAEIEALLQSLQC